MKALTILILLGITLVGNVKGHITAYFGCLSLPHLLLSPSATLNQLQTVSIIFEVLIAAMSWIESDLPNRRRFIFDALKFVRLPLVPFKLIDAHANACRDISLKVALESVKKDVVMRRGSLVALAAQPR